MHVRRVPAIFTPIEIAMRDLRDIVSEPKSMLGGLGGMIGLSALLVVFFVYGSNLAFAMPEEPDEELDIEFDPGEIARLGPKPEELPEKIIVEETRVEEEVVVEEAVTKDETPPPEPEEPPPEKPEDPKPVKDRPDPKKPKHIKVSDKNRESNTPYKDLPTVDQLPGDPFGSPTGWSDMMKDGDPWATAVMAELNKMKYPSYAAQNKQGTLTFRLRICKDGKIDQVLKRGSTGDVQLDNLMIAEIQRVKIPRPPPKVAAAMKSNCVFLRYEFRWAASGTVR